LVLLLCAIPLVYVALLLGFGRSTPPSDSLEQTNRNLHRPRLPECSQEPRVVTARALCPVNYRKTGSNTHSA
jgi:hypothetical protein